MIELPEESIRADYLGYSLSAAQKYGVTPVYFTRDNSIDPGDHFKEIRDLCAYFWTTMGFTGLMTPWHEAADPQAMFRFQKKSLVRWLWTCEDMDVQWQSYLVLSLCMTDYTFYERPALLFGQRQHWTWIRNFRKYAGSREKVDKVAFFLWEFMRIQVQREGRAYFRKGTFKKPDFSQKKKKDGTYPLRLELYQRILDRIQQVEERGIDYLDWLEMKCANLQKIQNSQLHLTAVVGSNSMDPNFEVLRKEAQDPWRNLRKFLDLSPECEFPDGSIPKGWQPASDDVSDRSQVRMITADGYYYYGDGTQRRGKWHYATNKYLTIRVMPENFHEFQESWNDPRLLAGRPTWSEYERFALYPDIWNADGVNVSEYRAIKGVRWRKP